jgi:hypothetical protein
VGAAKSSRRVGCMAQPERHRDVVVTWLYAWMYTWVSTSWTFLKHSVSLWIVRAA